jgi:hypothetical protein
MRPALEVADIFRTTALPMLRPTTAVSVGWSAA